MLTNQQYVVDDFSGGITDYPIDAKPNQSFTLENFVLNPNRKPGSAPGSIIYDSNMYRVPDGNVRISNLISSSDPNLYILAGRKVWFDNTTVLSELTGPSGNSALSAGVSSSALASSYEWAKHTFIVNDAFAKPIKIYVDGSGVRQVRTAGMPALANAPTLSSAGGTGKNYIYAFIYYYTYNVGTVVFSDFGPTTQVQLLNIGSPDNNTVSISVIPVISNGSTGNYDTANITVKIYRTIAGGSSFFYVGQVTNGTTTFNDTVADSTLTANNVQCYINGGIKDNDPPPPAKFIHIVNNTAYYGYVTEGSQVVSNRVRQSIADDPDSCPTSFTIDFLDDVMGISSYMDNPIVFTKNHVYRLSGAFNDLGQGNISYEDITKTIGCVSHNSIVATRYGLYWAGPDGFYWTDGYQYKKISDSINERYKKIVFTTARAARVYGTYNTTENRVYWGCQSDNSNTDNDSFFILDLRCGFNQDACTFTTRVNGDSFSPTAITYYNGQLIRADRRGYLFKHDPLYTTDPKIDISTVSTSWNTKAIVPLYESAIFNFGLPMVRKWVSRILLTMENLTNTSCQIYSINDNSQAPNALKEIRYRSNSLWGDPNILWNADTPGWNITNLIEEKRNYPAQHLRCSYKQMEITSSYTIIYNSDAYEAATTAQATSNTKTATLTTRTFPTDLVDYYIYFSSDSYATGYLLTAVSGLVATFQDNAGTAPVGSGLKWEIKGYPKGEIFNIVSYVIYYAPLTSQSYKTWRSEQDSTGANA